MDLQTSLSRYLSGGILYSLFLQRARQAQSTHAPDGEGARFQLVTNWNARPQDPLRKLIEHQTNALDINTMFQGGNASIMGRLRSLWINHLGIDEQELRLLVRTLRVNLRIRSGEDLREHLNDKFAAVGMRRIPSSEAGFSYDDLIRKLHAQGRKEFDALHSLTKRSCSLARRNRLRRLLACAHSCIPSTMSRRAPRPRWTSFRILMAIPEGRIELGIEPVP